MVVDLANELHAHTRWLAGNLGYRTVWVWLSVMTSGQVMPEHDLSNSPLPTIFPAVA